jgi:hypothetical protein
VIVSTAKILSKNPSPDDVKPPASTPSQSSTHRHRELQKSPQPLFTKVALFIAYAAFHHPHLLTSPLF